MPDPDLSNCFLFHLISRKDKVEATATTGKKCLFHQPSV
jgi:hypothetical protein